MKKRYDVRIHKNPYNIGDAVLTAKLSSHESGANMNTKNVCINVMRRDLEASHKASKYYLIDNFIFTDRPQRSQLFPILSSSRCMICKREKNVEHMLCWNILFFYKGITINQRGKVKYVT